MKNVVKLVGSIALCDSTSGQHARHHAEETGHQVMASYPVDVNSFLWCYAHNSYLDPDEKNNLKEVKHG